MKASADLKQARYTAFNRYLTLGWLGDAREDFQKRCLAGAIAADDSDNFSALYLEINVLERPELLDCIAGDDRAAVKPSRAWCAKHCDVVRASTSRNATYLSGCASWPITYFLPSPSAQMTTSAVMSEQIRKTAFGAPEIDDAAPEQERNDAQAQKKSGKVDCVLSPPSRHQRNPSMTPTTGLRLYQNRHCPGTKELENPTGDT